MKFEGGCHCGTFRYRLDWPDDAGPLPARRCTCGYCTRFNAAWTSHPGARLEINSEAPGLLVRYRFATATADFLFCKRCGVTFAAVCQLNDALRGIVNVNTLDDTETIAFDRSDSDFDSETRDQRLARRGERWIGSVTMPGST